MNTDVTGLPQSLEQPLGGAPFAGRTLLVCREQLLEQRDELPQLGTEVYHTGGGQICAPITPQTWS
jgi:hypothetical protein